MESNAQQSQNVAAAPAEVLDVCICTHNPRPDIFAKAIASLAEQSLAPELIRVLVVDNNSVPPITDRELEPLRKANIPFKIIVEPKLGNLHARHRVIKETEGEWVVFVDDDNELSRDYLERVLQIIRNHPELGCFGGKLLLGGGASPEPWMEPLLPFLAIRDHGDKIISKCVDEWGPWEPPTAGAAVRRAVLSEYMRKIAQTNCEKLGRKGRRGLLSGEDSLMMRGAYALKLHCGYFPELLLYHHLDGSRFCFSYLIKLLYGYGRSYVVLERCLGKDVPPAKRSYFWKIIRKVTCNREKLCRLAWELGYYFESRQSNLKA